MFNEASRTPSFDPSTSCHYTPTQAVMTLSFKARKNNSTSKANLFTCIALNNTLAVSFVNNLNPHCVSFVLIPKTTPIRVLNTNETNLLCILRCTFPSYYQTLLEPTTNTRLSLFSLSIQRILNYSLAKSLNFVAPSASSINMQRPLATETPARTAPPFPLFLGYSTTTVFNPSSVETLRATSVVESTEPSLTTMISQSYLLGFRYYAVSFNIIGNLSCSLQLGTTNDKLHCLRYFSYYSRDFLFDELMIQIFSSSSRFLTFRQEKQGIPSQRVPAISANATRQANSSRNISKKQKYFIIDGIQKYQGKSIIYFYVFRKNLNQLIIFYEYYEEKYIILEYYFQFIRT